MNVIRNRKQHKEMKRKIMHGYILNTGTYTWTTRTASYCTWWSTTITMSGAFYPLIVCRPFVCCFLNLLLAAKHKHTQKYR